MSSVTYAQLGGLRSAGKKLTQKALGDDAPATSSKVADRGFTSPVHEKYQGQIVLSSQEIENSGISDEIFSDNFTLGNSIFLRVFLKESLLNAMLELKNVDHSIAYAQGGYNMIMTLDDQHKTTRILYMKSLFEEEEFKTWTTWRGALDADGKTNYIGVAEFRDFIAEQDSYLTVGAHKVKIELYPSMIGDIMENAAPLATGSFTLNVNENSIDPNDTYLCLPAKGQEDAKLEAEIIEAFKKKEWKEQPQKAIITSSDWLIVKNNLTGIPLRRLLTATVASTREGKCIMQSFDFAQEFDGTGYTGKLYLYSVGSQDKIPCACME